MIIVTTPSLEGQRITNGERQRHRGPARVGAAVSPRLRAWTIPACLLLVACGGDRPAGGAPGSSGVPAPAVNAPAASSAETPPSPAPRGGIPLRDPVQLTATADVDGNHYQFSGLGECQHTADASIYEVPASMWSARFSDEAGKFTYLNLTLWQPKAAPAVQVSLGLTGAGETSEIATVKGSQLRGSGTGRIEPKGEGGALIVEGRDANGQAVRLTVDCSRFTEPVAEGG
jgi:hypothetical protein